MKLINDFYSVRDFSDADGTVRFAIALNREHFIYRAHFPGNPITPGVCLIQICRELLEMYLHKRLMLRRVANVKFLAVASPNDGCTLSITFGKIQAERRDFIVAATVRREATTLCKLGLVLALDYCEGV